jgi:hypothetical protein
MPFVTSLIFSFSVLHLLAYLSVTCCTTASNHPISKHKPHLFTDTLSGKNGNALSGCNIWLENESHMKLLHCLNKHTGQISHEQGTTNPRHQVTWATKLCMEAHNICGSPILNLLHVILLVPKILWWILDFWTICRPQLMVFKMFKLVATSDLHQLFKKLTGPQSQCTNRDDSIFILYFAWWQCW